jgi:hypothetical protein
MTGTVNSLDETTACGCAGDCENVTDCGAQCRRLGRMTGTECANNCDPCGCRMDSEMELVQRMREADGQ